MPNYDLPKPTPAELLEKRFAQIADEGLEPAMSISRSLDAIADAIRAFAHDPATLGELAQQVSQSAFSIGAVATIAPGPTPAPKAKAKKSAPLEVDPAEVSGKPPRASLHLSV